jgi:hypothetical protein
MSTFVAKFADGEVTRMTVWCDGELDWERGRNLARHAWQTRDRRRRIDEMQDSEPPEIAECHFEMANGEIVEEPSEGTEGDA